MTILRHLLREPLVLFLGLGASLFAAYGAVAPDNSVGSHRILVDREKLLTFMQYRANAFEPQRFGKILDSLSDDEVKSLVNEYVREEALYREAKKLELDRDDYLARRRLIQQLEFITRAFTDTDAKPSEAMQRAWFKAHEPDYIEPARITFTHVFFSTATWGVIGAKQKAIDELKILNRQHVLFSESFGRGDRFLYNVNYADKEAGEVASDFGQEMQQTLFAQRPDQHRWYGPFLSPHGFHLVMVSELTPLHKPDFADVRERVIGDMRQARQELEFNRAIEAIVRNYKIEVVGLSHARTEG